MVVSVPKNRMRTKPAAKRAEDAAQGVDGVDVSDGATYPGVALACMRTRTGKTAPESSVGTKTSSTQTRNCDTFSREKLPALQPLQPAEDEGQAVHDVGPEGGEAARRGGRRAAGQSAGFRTRSTSGADTALPTAMPTSTEVSMAANA